MIDAVTAEAFKEIGRRVRNGGTHEHEIQQFFMEAFQRENMVTDDPPIVAVNANSGNPHYEPSASRPVPIREGDFVLLDVWAKKNTPGAVYYDITWVGIVGKSSVRPAARNFQDCERGARYRREDRAGCRRGRQADCGMGSGSRGARPHQAGEIRRVLHPPHRPLDFGTEVHANGANMDDLEIHDERRILPNSCFSIEPGIYLPEFGVRWK